MARLDREQKNGNKSIYITQKRLSYNLDQEIEGPSSTESNNYNVLVRVTDGNKDKSKKIKLSTVVEPEKLDAFWNEYTNVLKAGLKGLKKKDKKKTKKRSKKS
ncbi:hypothetical protein OGAPHI_005921 [Ogataea philodendri]|uniref:Signal recognition particle subunit SRP14 n=1 Tax=Ogataea philodendri TaxID=1378263 RepID=A0A9P8T0G2_9ASCO|nr:uncharacterized protein OGAPHI_005921 [Ogataea philodendri]KAH3661743.1 hypothetical protein OGAPHI_005921 [Ogataea philodendri]